MSKLLLVLATLVGTDSAPPEQVTEMPVAIWLGDDFPEEQLAVTREVLGIASRLGGCYRTLGSKNWFAPYTIAATESVRSAEKKWFTADAHGSGAACADHAVVIVAGLGGQLEDAPAAVDWVDRCKPVYYTVLCEASMPLGWWRTPGGDFRARSENFTQVSSLRCTWTPTKSTYNALVDLIAAALGTQVAQETADRISHEWVRPTVKHKFTHWNPRLDDAGQAFQEAYLNVRAQDWAAAEKAFDELTKRYPREAEMWYYLGLSRHNLEKWREAIRAHEKAAELPGYIPYRALYNLACSHARLGETGAALTALRRSAEAGFADYEHASRDSDLASIRNDARFEETLETMRRRDSPR